MLSAINLHNPLFWGVLIGWILTVVLHEFSHGLVAWLGGDYTIRERGGLSLNPLQYIDPMMSIVLPVVFLVLGGIPLPGGATFIRRDLIRNRAWQVAVSAAGPAANFLIFLVLAVALNQRVGWVDYHLAVSNWPTEKIFVAALAFFQLFAGLLNLLPIPPLDGFQIISPFLPKKWAEQLMRPQVTMGLLLVFFFAIDSREFMTLLYRVMRPICQWVGVDLSVLVTGARVALFGQQ